MFIDTLNPKFRFFYDKADDDGADGKKKIETPTLPDEVLKSLKSLIKKSGGESDALEILYNDNKALRDKLNNMEGSQLGDGKVAVPKEDAKIIEKIKELGGLEKVETVFSDHDKLKAEIKDVREAEKIGKVAGLYGWNDEVLKDLLKGSEIEIKKTKNDDNEEVKRAFIKNDEGEVEIGSYINDKKSVYLPALESGGNDSENGGQRKKHVRQNNNKQGSSNASQSIVEKRKKAMKERSEKGNALNPKTSE